MDRDRHAWAEQLHRARSPRGSEVARAERRAPSPDGQQREVEVWFEPIHALEQVCIAGEVDGAGSAYHESDRRCPWTYERPAMVVVDRGGGHDLHAFHVERLAACQLLCAGKSLCVSRTILRHVERRA